jgi:hypothetical protein
MTLDESIQGLRLCVTDPASLRQLHWGSSMTDRPTYVLGGRKREKMVRRHAELVGQLLGASAEAESAQGARSHSKATWQPAVATAT